MKLVVVAALLWGIHANADVLFSDLGTGSTVYSTSSGRVIKGSGAGGVSLTQAFPFTVSGTGDFDLTQIDLAVWNSTGNPAFTAAIFTDNAGIPGVSLGSWGLTGTTFGVCCTLATQSGITGVTLTGGTTYFMLEGPTVLTSNTENHLQPNTVGLNSEQLTSQNGDATWNHDGTFVQSAFDVLGTSVSTSAPEPRSLLLVGTALAGLIFRRALARKIFPQNVIKFAASLSHIIKRKPFNMKLVTMASLVLGVGIAIPGEASTLFYVSDFENNSITAVDPSGNRSTFAALPAFGFVGLTMDGAGNLYVADDFGNRIVEFSPGGTSSIFATTGLSNPLGIAFDSSGNLYAANSGNGVIEEYTPGGAGSVFANTGASGPVGLAFDSSGNLFVSLGDGNIEKYTPGGVGSTFVTGLPILQGIVFDSAGNLYAADQSNTILKITPGGSVSTFANTGLADPEFMAFDSLGNLYVVNNANGTVEMFTPGGSPSLFASGWGNPEGIVFASTSTSTPEPSTAAGMLIGAGLIAVLRMRRRAHRLPIPEWRRSPAKHG